MASLSQCCTWGSLVQSTTRTHTLSSLLFALQLCQGPCPDNQTALVSCNVTCIINEVFKLDFKDRDPMLVFELRCAATLTLLSLLEGCNDPSRPKLICSAISFSSLQQILDSLWVLVKDDVCSGVNISDDQEALVEFAFNIFILLFQLRSSCAPVLMNMWPSAVGSGS